MSGSPVYIGDKLLGSLSYRIGQFSKEPIAGITPIEQMLEVRNLPIDDMERASAEQDLSSAALAAAGSGGGSGSDEPGGGNMNFQAMETPLVMSGFRPGRRSSSGSSRWRNRAWKRWRRAAWAGRRTRGAGISAAAADDA